MPVSEVGRFRVMRTKSGKKIRLHFGRGGEVDEAKNLKTGATHTPEDFMADKKAAGKRKPLRLRGEK